MILCLVTDRRRLAKAAGLGAPNEELLIQQIAGAVAAGIDLIQLRENDLEAGDLLRLVRRIVRDVPGAAGRLIVNDRLDVAMAGAAHGVHLKESSFDVGTARRLAPPPFLVGRSVHGPEGLAGKASQD